MNVLLTNDDGITATGLRALHKALKKAGHEVFSIAPTAQQSGTAHSVTVFSPLLTEKFTEGDFEGTGVGGTPADCVKLGLGRLCPFKPDLVISGINQGPNAGPDIHYSGTVGAAAEAAHAGIPAIAVSRQLGNSDTGLDEVAGHLVCLAEKFDWNSIDSGTVININYPPVPIAETAGMEICPHSLIQWPNDYSARTDPRGNIYWWFDSELDESGFEAGSDRRLLLENYITVTPLKFEYTDYRTMDALKSMINHSG